MKTVASVIPALMAVSILAAADPIRGASDFSLASLNSDAVFSDTTSMKIGSTLSQPDRRTVALSEKTIFKPGYRRWSQKPAAPRY